MKRLTSLLLCAVMALALAGCGAKSAPTEPPELTVTNAQGASITAHSGSYDWDYTLKSGERTGVIADGAHPLDEICRDMTPILEMPVAVSASFHYTVTLSFGDCAPDSVILRCWSEQCWGDTQAKAEKLSVQRQDDGTYTAALIPSAGIFQVDAQWDTEDYCGRAFYSFCTKAAEAEELPYSKTYSFGGEMPVKSLDISWLSGGVSVVPHEQISEITVVEQADRMLADGETLTVRLDVSGDGHSLHIGFMKGDRFDGEKYLTVYVPQEMVKNSFLDEIDIETTSAYAYVSADAQKIKLSTVGGDARVMGASCPAVEIETVSGSVGLVDGTWGKVELSAVSGAIELAGDAESAEIETTSGKVDIAGALGALDFESVSGDLILATERALRLDAETESGSIHLTLPAQDGFTLAHETKSGAFRSALTEREGTLITCLDDHATHYSVPALDGGAVSELAIKTVSGEVTIEASSFGSN